MGDTEKLPDNEVVSALGRVFEAGKYVAETGCDFRKGAAPYNFNPTRYWVYYTGWQHGVMERELCEARAELAREQERHSRTRQNNFRMLTTCGKPEK